jgi:hypothetical protein
MIGFLELRLGIGGGLELGLGLVNSVEQRQPLWSITVFKGKC